MTRVLVMGKNGQVASELRQRAGDSSDFRFLSREDIENAQIEALVETLRPTFIVNCAAYTAVDKAETDADEAYRLNHEFVSRLASLSRRFDSHLIHFSTDYVFDGTSRKPYEEGDPVNPLGVYGKSKLAGERSVFEIAESATILRTSWVYSQFGHNFVKTVIRLANGDKPLRVVDDQFGTPTSAGELADFVIDVLLERSNESGVELYHFSGAGETTWNGFAREIAALWGTRQKEIIPILTSEFPTPAKRPAYGVLSKNKLKQRFNFEPLDWKEALRRRYWGIA